MNEQEQSILEYLEYAYTGARAKDDLFAMAKIRRAIIAFMSDPFAPINSVFKDSYLEKYYQQETSIAIMN